MHSRAYDRILDDIPDEPEDFERWIGDWLASDQYLSRRIADGTFRAIITSPRVASQPSLLSFDSGDLVLASALRDLATSRGRQS